MQKLHFIVQKLKKYLKMNAGKVKGIKEYMLLLWIILSYPLIIYKMTVAP